MTAIDAPPVLLGEWARLIAATLAERGVRHVVVSPGSRSTPFVLAIGARADVVSLDVVDERCAAFVALGIARATGRPTALLCTSGTAAAHWYPAVIEASLTSVPLVLLTADRPIELAGCGAAQTIDQTKMFGDHVVHFADLGAPDASEGALRGLRRAVAQAVALAAGGPVHLDLRARKPLDPVEAKDARDFALRARVDAILARPATEAATSRSVPDPIAIDAIARRIDGAERPLLVVGPLAASAIDDGAREAVLAIARTTGAPLFAEATSQLRLTARRGIVAVDALDLSLRGIDARDEPDLVVQIGATPTSSALERLLAARPGLERVVIGVQRWTDPHGTAAAMVLGDPAASLGALARAVGRAPSRLDAAWRDRMVAADQRAWGAVDSELETGGFGEGAVARTLTAALPERALLTIGNSLPVRTIDRFVRGGRELTVLSQRGAAGIDGLVSGAIGASIALGRPGAVLLGDLSMLHDLGALASAPLVRAPLAIVVVQNGGGRIFEQLPIAAAAPAAIERFTTPQDVRFEHAAAAFGVPYARAEDAATLRTALDRALDTPGATLIEAVVPPHGARDAERRILEALAEGRA